MPAKILAVRCASWLPPRELPHYCDCFSEAVIVPNHNLNSLLLEEAQARSSSSNKPPASLAGTQNSPLASAMAHPTLKAPAAERSSEAGHFPHVPPSCCMDLEMSDKSLAFIQKNLQLFDEPQRKLLGQLAD